MPIYKPIALGKNSQMSILRTPEVGRNPAKFDLIMDEYGWSILDMEKRKAAVPILSAIRVALGKFIIYKMDGDKRENLALVK